MSSEFWNPYRHGFVRVAVAVPEHLPAEPDFNAERTVVIAEQAAEQGAVVTLFPELGLTGYCLDELFRQRQILTAAEEALATVLRASLQLPGIVVVGLPLRFSDQLFNCGVALCGGRIVAVVPKQFLPSYGEFYEGRYFSSASSAAFRRVELLGQSVPFGTDLLISAPRIPGLTLHMEICEDVWSPQPPSTGAALAGATILANLSASNVTIGKADYRKLLAQSQSAKCLAAYLYSALGSGESTTDLAWDGHAFIYENGRLCAEGNRFSDSPQLLVTDIDCELLAGERMRVSSFRDARRSAVHFRSTPEARSSPEIRSGADAGSGVQAQSPASGGGRPVAYEDTAATSAPGVPAKAADCTADAARNAVDGSGFRYVSVDIDPPRATNLLRAIPRFPYVPADPDRRGERCFEAYNIQVQALAKRLRATGIQRLVVGVSGGIDSTHALIVAARTMDRLGLPRRNILAYTMPGFGTSDRTYRNAWQLMKRLGVSASEIDITPGAMQALRDIGHPYAQGAPAYDRTFENVQAGERTSRLFRLANLHDALVVGTGDLSELALGWTTYGVGDHMSHYAVNASLPKTLIRELIRWIAESGELDAETNQVLRSILATEISPELVPGSGPGEQPRPEPKPGPARKQNTTEHPQESSEAHKGEPPARPATPDLQGASTTGEAGPAQRTEDIIGPYELQDFHLYYVSRYGFSPAKVAFLCYHAWHDGDAGSWPESVPDDMRNEYPLASIKKWLREFLRRFFGTSQFKRSCLPNGPKVGSGGSLSPRGDWRAPSDISPRIWIEALERNVPEDEES